MKPGDIEDIVLNYDPEFPQQRFLSIGLAGALKSSTGRLPSAVPWPETSKPIAVPLDPAPSPQDDLSRFKGYDAVVVTWTAAEAAALASLLTPDYLPSRWYEYRHNVSKYIPLVTGGTRALQRHVEGHGALLSQPRTLFSLQDRPGARSPVQVRIASRL